MLNLMWIGFFRRRFRYAAGLIQLTTLKRGVSLKWQATCITPLRPNTFAAFPPWRIQRELVVQDLPLQKYNPFTIYQSFFILFKNYFLALFYCKRKKVYLFKLKFNYHGKPTNIFKTNNVKLWSVFWNCSYHN